MAHIISGSASMRCFLAASTARHAGSVERIGVLRDYSRIVAVQRSLKVHPSRSILALAVLMWFSSAAIHAPNRWLNPVLAFICARNTRASCSAYRQVSLATPAQILASDRLLCSPPPLRGAKVIGVIS